MEVKRLKVVCQECVNELTTKVKLKCGHTMCTECVSKFVLDKFMNKQRYKHAVFCPLCNKIVELSMFYIQ